ncbi:MAG: DNA replication and repair protein RecF [Bacteroidia bacterium]|nr:DNA replication and repair protein RecF [Bacteroidia bacterium]MCX7652924.1 DNA replication and repair protein RecF [Bacteroidia bacterium]MDW8416608.1 DNA replication and repair protein RecF [Bacteroidia bacterium]
MLRAIELSNFRCYAHIVLELGERGTAWVGPNASGKTSILEAIQKLTILRGFGKDEEMVRWGSSAYRLRARVSEGIVELLYEKGKGNRLYWQGELVQPLSQWVGRFPVVSLRPADISWIEGSAAERRRWSDKLLCQISPAYLEALSRYQRALDQRNALLSRADVMPAQLELWETLLISEGIRIQKMRQELSEHFSPILAEFYTHFGGEPLELNYKLSVEMEREAWLSAWQRLRKDEQRLGRTLIGPHLEDFILRLDGRPARGYASEGQKKSLLIALKWAEVAHLRAKGGQPILLLDDVGEKLDRDRLSALGRLSRLAMQTFLTDTDLQRVRDTFPEVEVVSMPLR